jgi:hypothetical protein
MAVWVDTSITPYGMARVEVICRDLPQRDTWPKYHFLDITKRGAQPWSVL